MSRPFADQGSLISSRRVHRGRSLGFYVDRVLLPNGVETDLDVVRHPGASAIVPFVTESEILMIRHYRWAAGGWLEEIPAGKLEAGDDPASCAARELEEETGHVAGRIEPLGSILTAPGFTDERIHLFAAHDLKPSRQALESDEVLEVVRVPLDEALSRARSGAITDAKTLCALFQLALRRPR